MTPRLQVLLAVKALIQETFPNVTVLGLENEGAAPDRIPDEGRIVIRAGDPGEPTIELSPLTYWYDHQIPVEIAVRRGQAFSADDALDAMLEELGTAIAANRRLGGLVTWLDSPAPPTADLFVSGAEIMRAADLTLTATYATTNPL